MRKHWGTWIALAAAATIAVGCGGDDDDGDDTTTSASVTKAEYVQTVEDTCSAYLDDRREAEKPLRDLFASAERPTDLDPEELQDGADELAALNDTTRGVIDEIVALPRPEGETETEEIEQIVAGLEAGSEALDEVDEAAAEGDGAGVQSGYRAFDQAVSEDGKLGAEYGVDVCGG
jgi:hypothetical protein